MLSAVLGEWDNLGPPTLGDITVNGRKIKAWPIQERSVPESTVPGRLTSPTQPFPTKPPAFDRQGISEDDLIDFTPELAAARGVAKQYVLGPMYTPPTLSTPDGTKATLMMPGAWGAGN